MSFTDERGTIRDLVGPVDAITHIHTVEGAVRGNHFHNRTKQWTYVIKGCLVVADGTGKTFVRDGGMIVHDPGTPHAWLAMEDTDCLVFTRGPRSGDQYETDTFRLDEPLLP